MPGDSNESWTRRPPGAVGTMSAVFIWLCLLVFCPDNALSASSQASLVKLDIRYGLPAAGEVFLVWGVNGWNPVPEALRPPGTTLRKEVMSTPMVQDDGRFVATIEVETGATVDYGFLVTKTAGGAFIEVWDGDETYRLTAIKPEMLDVKSVKLYQNTPILMDRAGAMFAAVLAMVFGGLLATAARLLWSKSQPVPSDESSDKGEFRFVAVVSLSALLLGLIVILQHELWRDEMQAWRIATSSRTLSELFQNSRYEGHPPIWYLCLYVLSRFSDDPLVMQLFHLAVGTGAIFVLCRYAPFTRWQKVCLSFGYFFFFEYLIISRNYALGVLALFVFCAVQTRAPGRTLVSAVLLAAMINTSAFGAIIALALGGWLVIESLVSRRTFSLSSGLAAVAVLAIGLAIAGMQTTPPPDNSPRMLAWNTALLGAPLEKTVSGIWRSYVPLPLHLPHFWNTNVLDEMHSVRIGRTVLEARDVQPLLSLGLLMVSALLFMRTPSVMLLYTVATGGLLLFFHLKVNHGIRHTGHTFVLFVGCLWLSLSRFVQTSAVMERGSAMFVSLLFSAGAVAGGLAAATDLVYPFSASKEAAEFIERHGLADTAMIGSGYAMAAGVAGYLNHPVYYAENRQTGTFVQWREKRTRVTPAEVMRMAEEQSRQKHSDILMILSYDLGAAGTDARKLASFERSVLPEERYWLYLLPYEKPTRTSSGRPCLLTNACRS
ncbi:MAG TPA: hypothetical protein VJ805_11635 [Nitrospiraceae bacterium]|nr:hypothetical protein [Nitrospiraceae bacterium]